MLKRITFTFTLMLLSFAVMQAQSLMLTPYGQSDRDVAIDTLDMFDVAYDGLQKCRN
jgi:hypothetical protein